MGQAWWIQPTNNTSTFFSSTALYSNCFYQLNNLTPVNIGGGGSVNNQYVEAQNSGACFLKTSYFQQWYGAPGIPAGDSYFGIGLISSGATMTLPVPPWVASIQTWGSYTAYLYSVPGSYILDGLGLGSEPGGTVVFKYSIASPASDAAAPGASGIASAVTPRQRKEPPPEGND